MKIAIIFAGPYRASETIIKNQLNMIGNYDIYVSCFEHYKEDWINSGWDIKQIFTTPFVNFNETNWSNYRNDEPGQAGFWQFWNLKNVIDNVPKNYDFYIKSRNDIIFETELQLDQLTLKPKILYSPNNSFHTTDWDIDKWVNDEFYIGCGTTMNVISQFVTNFYNTFRHTLNQAAPYIGSNEASLKLWLTENNIKVQKIYDISYKKNHYGISTPSGFIKFQLEKL